MKKFRTSIHTTQQLWLRERFIEQRKTLGLSQRSLAEKLNVIYSLIGKVETGDRRLDVFEFIEYCQALELDPVKLVQQLEALQKQP
ncbi:transcriptional regulator [Chelonobacter oris]|uniref:HTH cro/C1-type domain-containing protein n=1 Tax=Chelonobacter oris TaxID=505317 RepID=A0A0A3ALR8_9PAST|nr:helix-turn-helix transcriptional regulator [Chelonobacter oris]KGQ70353.1 hypothetical protein OA57_05720 [Chelonobacter oris]MDH3000891.1 transcriptional regulator [Chelonobacter oris]